MLRILRPAQFRTIIACAIVPLLISCSGYKLGNAKPRNLAHIKKIAVPMLENQTQEIKLAPQATNALVTAISNDGSYRIASENNADATLTGTIQNVKYSAFRANRLDTLLAEELTMVVSINWELKDNAGNVLQSGTSTGSTRFFADVNQRLSRDNAIADALQDAAQKITSRISNGF